MHNNTTLRLTVCFSNSKYPYQRITQNLKVPYYVKETFERDYKGNIKQVEVHVEENYISNLQSACFKEQNYSKSLRSLHSLKCHPTNYFYFRGKHEI